MARPLPVLPRLARRKADAPRRVILGCPRISPHWELGALRALIKPQTGDAIAHTPAAQAMPTDWVGRVQAAIAISQDRLGYRPIVHWPEEGDYLFLIEVDAETIVEARALAAVISSRCPGVWFVLGRLFIRDGVFFRRERGFRLNLVPASNIHLPRSIRQALRGHLSCNPSPSKPKPSGR